MQEPNLTSAAAVHKPFLRLTMERNEFAEEYLGHHQELLVVLLGVLLSL
jgi:hypothetical protein